MTQLNGSGPTIEVPQYAFTIEMQPETDPPVPWYIGLEISTSGTRHQAFLCLPNPVEVEKISRIFGRELLRVATTLKRNGKRIELVTGVDSASLRTKEGR